MVGKCSVRVIWAYFKRKVAVDQGIHMGSVGPHKHSKGAQSLSEQGHFLSSPLLTELSVPSSDQKVSSVMSGILNVSVPFRSSSRRKRENYSYLFKVELSVKRQQSRVTGNALSVQSSCTAPVIPCSDIWG